MTTIDSPTLLSLADRVESERPSQELNADIWLATRVGFSDRSFNHWVRMQPKGSNPTELEYARDRAPNFSGSLDAAMTLVPEGHGFYFRRNCSGDGEVVYCNAQVWPFSDPRDDEAPRYSANSPENAPAMALVAACLKARARAASESKHD